MNGNDKRMGRQEHTQQGQRFRGMLCLLAEQPDESLGIRGALGLGH